MNKSKESFRAAVERGWELEVYNDGYKKALAYMNEVDPKAFYSGDEFSEELKLINWMGQ
ncbi:hypothetical protein D3C87_2039510 [compost metagenome]